MKNVPGFFIIVTQERQI